MRSAVTGIALTLALASTPQAHGRAEVSESGVDALFGAWTDSTPGCAVGVSVNGRTVLEKAYGMANLEHDVPNRPDTIFEAGSVAKQFTAAAILLLARDGKLSLEDSVRRYVPEMPEYASPITLRQLLQHTSGLRDWGSVAEISGWPRGTRVHTHAHVLDILSRQRSLNFAPGARWSYSNSGYNLAAIIVARVSGKSFAEFTRDRIFRPLGMTRTSWRDDFERIVKGRAVAYAESGGRYTADMPFENVHGNGGLLTTVGDLLKWNRSFDDPEIGDAAFVQELQTPGRLNDGTEHGYGFGLGIGEYKGLREVRHSGTTASYRACLARYPDQRLSAAVLCNAGNSTPRETLHAVTDLYLAEELESYPEPPAAAPSLAELDALAGMYRNVVRGDVVKLERHEGSLRFEHESPLRAITTRKFTDGEGTVIEFHENGAATMDEGSGLQIRFERVEAARPIVEDLAALAGTYVSDEAETALTLRMRDGILELKQRPDTVLRLTPLYEDAFECDLGTIIFRRDESGRAVAFSVVQDRVWDLRFTRRP